VEGEPGEQGHSTPDRCSLATGHGETLGDGHSAAIRNSQFAIGKIAPTAPQTLKPRLAKRESRIANRA
jgi:hypothetical protein